MQSKVWTVPVPYDPLIMLVWGVAVDPAGLEGGILFLFVDLSSVLTMPFSFLYFFKLIFIPLKYFRVSVR